MLAHLLLLLPMEQDRERVWFLYQKLKEKLMYAALQLLQQRDLAENAVEDAFLYLIHHFHELDTEDDQRVAAYLYQCVRHSLSLTEQLQLNSHLSPLLLRSKL